MIPLSGGRSVGRRHVGPEIRFALEPLLPSVLLRDRKWRRRGSGGGHVGGREGGETYAPEQFSGKCIHQRLRTL